MRSSSGPAVAVRPVDIVAVGVDAAALDALEAFVAALPEDDGLAWLVIAAPAADGGELAARLQRSSALPVEPIGARLPSGGRVLFAEPGDAVMLAGNRLQVDTRPDRPPPAPIDLFMRSLAAERGAQAIGVLLSGHPGDGQLGLAAIRAAAGLTLASACSAAGGERPLADGEADLVGAAAQLPGQLLAQRRAGAGPPAIGRAVLEQILLLLRAHTGHDFSHYKKTSLGRRIERRIGVHRLERAADYVAYLRENPRELSLLFKELLIGVTSFFRDPEAWQRLESDVLPALLARHAAERPLRAWVAGCSTGEEAYTLAIVLDEALERAGMQCSVQLFATDIDADAIERARAGWYPAGIANDLTAERLERYFSPERDGFRIVRPIRERVVFAPHNVFMDAPFTRLDLLVCRNLLIYLEPELQRKLFPLFRYCLNPDGVLLLGNAETAGRQGGFTPVDSRARLYRRSLADDHDTAVEFPARSWRVPPAAELQRVGATNLQQVAEQLLLQAFSPAAVLVNAQGDILFVNGRTGRYLEPAAGRANWNIYAMARKGLGQELALALPRALREKTRVDCPEVEIDAGDGPRSVSLSVVGLDQPEALSGMALVLFGDQPRGPVATIAPTEVARQQLQLAREAVRTTRDEMRAQQDALRSANEELQSTNEELQSANEELTTSKEEMQALNAELQALNTELQARLCELSRANSDIDNLLSATGLGVLFLDAEARVRRFSDDAARLFRLVPADVGRCIGDFASALQYPQLTGDVARVLRSLAPCSRELADRDGCIYRARMTPYRSRQQVIDGVVLVLSARDAADRSDR